VLKNDRLSSFQAEKNREILDYNHLIVLFSFIAENLRSALTKINYLLAVKNSFMSKYYN